MKNRENEGGKIIPLHTDETVKVFHGFKGQEDLVIQQMYKIILDQLGENVEREGLVETPKRHLNFLSDFIKPPPFNFTTFENEGGNDMIVQTGIEFQSLCEHHILPFFGEATVAYLPSSRIVGLSKLARCVENYARGFQNQERITQQVAERLHQEINPIGVAVILKARHMCMEMRGIRKSGSQTITSFFTGDFRHGAFQDRLFQRLAA